MQEIALLFCPISAFFLPSFLQHVYLETFILISPTVLYKTEKYLILRLQRLSSALTLQRCISSWRAEVYKIACYADSGQMLEGQSGNTLTGVGVRELSYPAAAHAEEGSKHFQATHPPPLPPHLRR